MPEAPTKSTLHEYLTEAGELPADTLLGRIVLFTITDQQTLYDDMDTWFDELGLSKDMMPVRNKAVDAFRKATSDTNKTTYPLPSGQEASLLCRDVSTNDNYVRRQITREVRDSKKKRLTYDEAITCTFYRAIRAEKGKQGKGERLHVQVRRENLAPDEMEHVDAIADNIKSRFMDFYQYLDGNKVRGTVRKYLKHLNAIEIKGGVYFVHIDKDKELQLLAEFVGRLGGGCYMQTLPLLDLAKERSFIAAAFEREASQALQDLTREARGLMETRKSITPAMYQKMRARFDTLLSNASEHMASLEVSQDVTAAAAEVALKALGDLQEEMLRD